MIMTTGAPFLEALFQDLKRHSYGERSVIFLLPNGTPAEFIQAFLANAQTAHVFLETPDTQLLEQHEGKLSALPGPFDPLDDDIPPCSVLVFCFFPRQIKARLLAKLVRRFPVRHIYHLTHKGWRRRLALTFLANRLLQYAWLRLVVRPPLPKLLQIAKAIRSRLKSSKACQKAIAKVLDQGPLLPASEFRKKQILLVSMTLGGGGAERQAVATAVGLARLGHSVGILCTQIFDDKVNRFYLEELRREGIAVSQASSFSLLQNLQPFASSSLKGLPGWARDEVTTFAYEFARLRPEVVHVWQDLPFVALAAVLAGVPRVVLSWRTLSPRHYPQASALLKPAYQALADHGAVSFTCNSKAGAEDYADYLGIAPSRIRVLRNGLDAMAWTPARPGEALAYRQELDIPETALVVGGIFRFVREKDPVLWIKVAGEVLRLAPDTRFVLFGDGEYRAQMEHIAGQFPQKNQIIMPGVTKAAAQALSIFDVFLLTSQVEGTPNVLIEAQMCGVPVVSTDAGGAKDTFENGRSGLLATSRNPQEIAKLIVKILHDPQWREEARSAARGLAVQRFGMERMVTETLSAYGLHQAGRDL